MMRWAAVTCRTTGSRHGPYGSYPYPAAPPYACPGTRTGAWTGRGASSESWERAYESAACALPSRGPNARSASVSVTRARR